MKGRNEFTKFESDQIIKLIRQKLMASTNEQKSIRNRIRALGFYASDFGIGGGYTEKDFLRVVTIIDNKPNPKDGLIEKNVIPGFKPDDDGIKIKKYAFPPISSPESKVLILGTMPGERSLALNQYYGHRGNLFWKIIFHCFNKPFTADYEVKKQLLIDYNIALWDVLQRCEREGSNDNNISAEVPNDFARFFKEHSGMRSIIFNGKNAHNYYLRHVGIAEKYRYQVLPSTSPSNTWMSKEEKVEKWATVLRNSLYF